MEKNSCSSQQEREKTLDQAKKKLRDLKEKSKRSGEARNLPNYFDVFDEVLGTRSLVQLGEVREKNLLSQEANQGCQISNDNNACANWK